MTASDYQNLYTNQLDAWREIISDSATLLQLAHRKNWTELLALHEKRDQALKAFFEQALTQDLVETVQNDLQKITEQDREIVQLVKKNQDELSTEAQQLNQMKRRINDYLSAEKSKL